MNRVIKDSIWSSPSLAKLHWIDQLHWPRWLLEGDDWGCFESGAALLKGKIYPYMDEVDNTEIERLKDVYFNSGKIFFWWEGDREYGFFVSHINHQFCNATSVDATTGRQVRHKRKTPVPPSYLLKRYMNCFKQRNQIDTKKLERIRTFKAKYLNPNLNPIPKPIPNHPSGSKDFFKGKDKAIKEFKNAQNGAPKTFTKAFNAKMIKLHNAYPDIGVLDWLKEKYPNEKFKIIKRG